VILLVRPTAAAVGHFKKIWRNLDVQFVADVAYAVDGPCDLAGAGLLRRGVHETGQLHHAAVRRDRELPVVRAVAKGSLVNKAIRGAVTCYDFVGRKSDRCSEDFL
jgi:hypothetical protein